MEEIEKPRGEGHYHLIGDGIDRQKLMKDKEIEFEVDDPSGDDVHDYFDGETVFKNLNFECTDKGDDSDSDSDQTPFQKMAIGMEDITPNKDGGVLKKILIPGIGDLVPQGASVKVHYNAYLEYSEEPFDSSILRNSQMFVKLGSGEQILGWDVGILTMKKNEKSRFLIKPEYAYGKMGCPPRIPAEATVLFEIELKSFVDIAKADDFESRTREERDKMTFHDRLCVVDSLRQKGNDEFNSKRLMPAFRTYKTAIEHLETCRLANEEEEIAMKKSCLTLYLNASLCAIRLGNWRNGAYFAKKALGIENNNVKARYRLGKALAQMTEFAEAKRHLMAAQALAPSNKEIREELKQLNDNFEEFRQMEKFICTNMFNPQKKTASLSALKKSDIANDGDAEGMLSFIKEKIGEFKSDSSRSIMPLPPSLKPSELEEIRLQGEADGFIIENGVDGILCLKKT